VPEQSDAGLSAARLRAHEKNFMERVRMLGRWPLDSLKQLKCEDSMDKDRVKGSFEQAKGKVKEVAGTATGDSKLETEGRTQQVAGKVQNTVGGIKDTVKEALKD
jgi:uncharacterized protein YjbJ (UPF0337 family)